MICIQCKKESASTIKVSAQTIAGDKTMEICEDCFAGLFKQQTEFSMGVKNVNEER